MDIREEPRGDALLVAAAGRLDSNSAPALEAVLPARAQANAKLVLDLSDVPYVSSAGLRVLLMGAKAARANGHKLVLAGLSPSVREVFDISGFTSIFAIEPDVDSALATLG
jgi:anti-sigma B factor antagonist